MTCVGCGRPFEPKRRDHRYCSSVCRSRDFVRQRLQREDEQTAELGAEVARIGQALELLQARHIALAERVDRMTRRSPRPG